MVLKAYRPQTPLTQPSRDPPPAYQEHSPHDATFLAHQAYAQSSDKKVLPRQQVSKQTSHPTMTAPTVPTIVPRRKLETLHIYSPATFRSTPGRVLDSTKSPSPLYTYQTHSFRSPDVEVQSGVSGQTIGTVNLHSFSTTIDLTLHGQGLVMQSNGTYHSGHQLPSHAPGTGGSLKWQDAGGLVSGAGKVCFDATGKEVARFEESSMSRRKEGKLHLSSAIAAGGQILVDEVVLSLLAELEEDNRNSAVAGGNSGGHDE